MDERTVASGLLKLTAKPIKINVYLDWEPKDTKDLEKGFKPQETGDGVLEAWLHPLTKGQMIEIQAIWIENYRLALNKGMSENDARWRGQRGEECQQFFFTVRKSAGIDSEPIFKEEEIPVLNRLEIARIADIYNKTFKPTRDEIKNSLRERLGMSSATSSTSPRDSGRKSSSRKEH